MKALTILESTIKRLTNTQLENERKAACKFKITILGYGMTQTVHREPKGEPER